MQHVPHQHASQLLPDTDRAKPIRAEWKEAVDERPSMLVALITASEMCCSC